MSHFYVSRVLVLGLVVAVGLALTQSHWRWWSIERNDLNVAVQGDWSLGEYRVVLTRHHLWVDHVGTGQRVFKTLRGERFIHFDDEPIEMVEDRGMIEIDPPQTWEFCNQQVDQVEFTAEAVVVSGYLGCINREVEYALSLQVDDGALVMKLDGPSSASLASISFEMSGSEATAGFGAQFSHINMRGRILPVIVSEQGIGRGAQPMSWIVDMIAGAAGDWSTTYAPIPWFLTSEQRAFWLVGDEPSWFDFTTSDRVVMSIASSDLELRIYRGDSPKSLISQFAASTGVMKAPPNWVDDGLIAGLQGGVASLQKYQSLREAMVPVTGVWLQDWVGQRSTSFGKQLWWNWQLDTNHYANWVELNSTLAEDGVKTLGYINPYMVEARVDTENDLWRVLDQTSGFVGEGGEPTVFQNTSFTANLVDFYDDQSSELWLSHVSETLRDVGFSGWMADFAEAYPYLEGHNRYPVRWSQVNSELRERVGQNAFIFSRAGYVGSNQYLSAFWLGDQNVTWDAHDGIKSSVTGLLSASMSGMTVNHTDIGGYTTGDHWLLRVTRSRELLHRWLELNSFGLILRGHEGNIPELNAQLYDEESLEFVKAATERFVKLAPYRRALYTQMESSGIPPIRHPLIEYPEISRFWGIRFEQFFVGSDLLLAPVLDEGTDTVNVILPEGEWLHIASGELFGGDANGRLIRVAAPIGQPAAFVRPGSLPHELLASELPQRTQPSQ